MKKIPIDELYDKYEPSVLQKLNFENINQIIDFLNNEKMSYIDEVLTDYLDLFLFPCEEFIQKFNKLKQKYGDDLVEKISENMNILEEMYYQ